LFAYKAKGEYINIVESSLGLIFGFGFPCAKLGFPLKTQPLKAGFFCYLHIHKNKIQSSRLSIGGQFLAEPAQARRQLGPSQTITLKTTVLTL
jgi:hypothetical protein